MRHSARCVGEAKRSHASRMRHELGREGIEPLVIHLTCFTTTALQAAVRITTRAERSPKFQEPNLKTAHLWTADWNLELGSWNFRTRRPVRALNPAFPA